MYWFFFFVVLNKVVYLIKNKINTTKMKYYLLSLTLLYSLFSSAQVDIQDDFEGNGTINSWFGDDCALDSAFSNPYIEGINTSDTVLKYVDTGGSYANVRFESTESIDISVKNTFSFKIYVPSSGITGNQTNRVSLKLQDGTLGSPWVTQSEIIKPIVLNQWQEVSFNFETDNFINLDPSSPDPITRSDFNRVVIQVNGEGNTDHVIAYIDEVLHEETDSNSGDGGNSSNPIFDHLVWSDEFNGAGAIDNNKWFHQTKLPSGGSWYNGEIQHYTNREINSFERDGALNLVAKKESFTDQGHTKQYTSARLNSKFAFMYGRVEVRAKLPQGIGTWPAIWMLGKNIIEPGGYWTNSHGTLPWPACGEIDIMEHWGMNQNYVQSAMHTPSSYGGTVNHGGKSISNVSSAFHIYELEWSSEKMVFSVDGVVHYTYNPPVKNTDTWPFDADQYLLLNIAIEPGVSNTFSQSTMEIDYVRVYQESTASSLRSRANEIKIYPNPINDKFTIKTPSTFIGAKGTMYSINGSKVKTFFMNELKQDLDCKNLTKGIYFLKLETDAKVGTFKLVKN